MNNDRNIWQRITSLHQERMQNETWIHTDRNGIKKEHSVEVLLGKPVDILSLKIQDVELFSNKVESLRASRRSLYDEKKQLDEVTHCPVCAYSRESASSAVVIHDVQYVRCAHCSHYFALQKPSAVSLDAFYKTNVAYQNTYADRKTQQQRLEWVSKPKAEYVVETYKKKYGRPPKNVLDVGAGSGHFVYQMRSMGIECDGIEMSEPGRNYAKTVFDVALLDGDFLTKADTMAYDMVTFWGLIEHVPQPTEMLRAAYRALRAEGMVIAEVPRWESLSTAVDCVSPDSVIRHIDPLDHVQCFSDASLATCFVLGGFDIVAAWYFGMDAYELLSQATYRIQDNKLMQEWGKKIPLLQDHLDMGHFCDFLLFAGVPSKE